MKRIIAGMIGAAVLGGAVVAQEVTFYNKLGGTLVHKPIGGDGDVYTSELYDEMRGTYDSEKFSFWGNLRLGLKPTGPAGDFDAWEYGASGFIGNGPKGIETGVRLATAFRPLPFLEVIGDFGAAAEEGLWSAKYLPGAYGYGSDIHYGLSKWAQTKNLDGGLIVALRGEGIGVDGLTAGWKVVEGPLYEKDGNGDTESLWTTALGVSYVTEVFGIGFGARLGTPKDYNQEFGIYGEITAVENLKVGLGATMQTDATSWGFNKVTTKVWSEEEFTAALNVGAEYSFAGMGLPLLVGADFAMLAGERTVYEGKYGNDSLSYTVMPMVVGGFVSFGVMENLILDLRVIWETDNGKYSGKKEYEASAKPYSNSGFWKTSLLTVEPRVTFLLTEADEFRLDVPVYYQTKDDTDATGVDLELYWKHFF